MISPHVISGAVAKFDFDLVVLLNRVYHWRCETHVRNGIQKNGTQHGSVNCGWRRSTYAGTSAVRWKICFRSALKTSTDGSSWLWEVSW